MDKAVALKYNKTEDKAPIIIAKGKGEIAKKIIQIAKQHNIPIWGDEALVEILSFFEVNEEIPEFLYEIIAEILLFVYKLEKKWDEKDKC